MTRPLPLAVLLLFLATLGHAAPQSEAAPSVKVQLNWLHDPTFAGEYAFAENSLGRITLREGGPNIFPVAEVQSGRADLAVVGADIFLKAERWSWLVRQGFKVDLTEKGTIHHEDAQTVYG